MLTSRQQTLFNEFLSHPDESKVASDFVAMDLGVERTTVFRDLKKMVDAGLLTLEGKSYRLNSQSDAYLKWGLSCPPDQRPAVKYNPKLLNGYKSNRTFLLSDKQIKSMEHVGSVSGVKKAHALGKSYERVLAWLLIDLTHASSNFENVNISWLDTKALIEFGERPKGLSEKGMRIAFKEAIGYLQQHQNELSLTKRDLMDVHSLLINGLLTDESAIGTLRSMIVKFDDSTYQPPDNAMLLKEAFMEFCDKATAIKNPFEQAFFVMSYIPYLQPFQDGNKRTSRIAMNIPLIRHKLAPFSFSDMGKRDYFFGLLALYERGRFSFLAEAFTNSYAKSAQRYADMIRHINDGGILGTISSRSLLTTESGTVDKAVLKARCKSQK